MSRRGFLPFPPQPNKDRETENYCQNCSHHGSFHSLIPREKWHELSDLIEPGTIPWFCEYSEENPMTGEKNLCKCNNYSRALNR